VDYLAVIMHPASAPEFQALRTIMESDWTPQMMIDTGSLPIIWDADLLYGPRDTSGSSGLHPLNVCDASWRAITAANAFSPSSRGDRRLEKNLTSGRTISQRQTK
jgi:hypothetical protein